METPSETLLPINWDGLYYQAAAVFNPTTPIDTKDLFSGRTQQIDRIIDVIFQKGQHVILFGERGVGKTSLANVFSSFVPGTHSLLSARVNCDKTDTFESIWVKVFNELRLIRSSESMGFIPSQESKIINSKEIFNNNPVTPDSVRQALSMINKEIIPILVIDEFDRVRDEVRKPFADLIKNLADHSLMATVMLIGVGDSVDSLISEHQSISRSLVQVPMPRMNAEEISNIINSGLRHLDMIMDDVSVKNIILLSQGLPHYTHLLGLLSVRNAILRKSLNVSSDDLKSAISKAIENTQQSIRTTYHTAIRSAHKDNIFAEVLLACALSKKDEIGTFAARDIEEPLGKIMGKYLTIPSFARHLGEFCENKREGVLVKTGIPRGYRYKFIDPLLQPYIIMKGLITNKIDETIIPPTSF